MGFLDVARERVLVYDGGFGTYMQAQALTADDFGGEALEGCNEMLVLTRPDLVAKMHDDYFAVGVDVVETATFGAFAIPLAEYDAGDQAHEINIAAARIAREVADRHSTPDHPGSWPAPSVRAPRCPPSATSPSPSFATPTRSSAGGCSKVASTSC
ncbi:MAG: homocysteine S-methyltransferase family protein [Acidimicrobiales bacterium]|nr:homocysteine S-methyltransferase family protein [Acidimicrobiales bacterium]